MSSARGAPCLSRDVSCEVPMKSFLDRVGEMLISIIYCIGCVSILIYADNHWPFWTTVFTFACLAGFTGWYIWRYFIRPFRAALKDDGKDGNGN